MDDAPESSIRREVAAYWKEERGPQYLPSFAFFDLGLSGGGLRNRGSVCLSVVGRVWQKAVVRHVRFISFSARLCDGAVYLKLLFH